MSACRLRCPVLLCPAGQDEEIGAPPLMQMTVVSQPGLPHNEVYYPYLSFRIERALQVTCRSIVLRAASQICDLLLQMSMT